MYVKASIKDWISTDLTGSVKISIDVTKEGGVTKSFITYSLLNKLAYELKKFHILGTHLSPLIPVSFYIIWLFCTK